MADVPSAHLRALFRRRADAFARFREWQSRADPPRLDPRVALSAATGLYDLLPRASRHRPVSRDAVSRLHARLAVLGRRS